MNRDVEMLKTEFKDGISQREEAGWIADTEDRRCLVSRDRS